MEQCKIRHVITGMLETMRHRPLSAAFDTGEELFLGTCGSREFGGAGVLASTKLVMNIDSFEKLTTWTCAVEKMWINAGFDNLRRLRCNIRIRQRRDRAFLHGREEFLQGRASIL
ncbi:hypothetical protein Y032_0997g3341 [Ancylostoma ceylanicum]|uniref:Uncharacterized protein n=1 Tax=Ancylostoma ceylanicum TaxID=53326 RepID=A0A016W789_9BILA|nr:hypothetical protein Y032_0997g3341 [Ancylostoma ceylanicum]